MRRLLLLSLLLSGTSAVAQTPSAPKASKHLRLPPIEGLARRLPREFDPAPVLRYDGQTDCAAYVTRIAEQSPPPAKVEEPYDGCSVLRRETADQSRLDVGGGYRFVRTI